MLNIGTVNMCVLFLEVQDHPQLKTGVRDCNFNLIVARLLLSFLQKRMLIDVEYTPDLFILHIQILVRLRRAPTSFLHGRSPLHKRLRSSTGANL
jgi:hypothetical protein